MTENGRFEYEHYAKSRGNDIMFGAEWMAAQGWTIDGEVKDMPTGADDFEIYLDYDRAEMDKILDNICDYVNGRYADDENRYKVTIQIRVKE